MTAWFTSPETTPRDTCPNENFVRFVANNYGAAPRSKVCFLDIGSGSGANASYLEAQGYGVVALDASPWARAHIHADCSTIRNWSENFDCIFDINTLCHVKNPPYEAIFRALKPGGKFFSIHPAIDTEVGMVGKGYTRLADAVTMRRMLGCFMRLTIHKSINWSGDTKIASWQIVCEK